MGVDIYSYIVVGERFVKKEVVNEVLRYDETTGTPHKKQMVSTSWVSVESPSIEWDEKRFEDLSLEIYESEWFAQEKFVGIQIVKFESGEEKWGVSLSMEIILSKQKEYKELMKREAKVWTVLEVN